MTFRDPRKDIAAFIKKDFNSVGVTQGNHSKGPTIKECKSY